MITSTINYKKLLHGVLLFFVLHEAWGQGMPQVIPPSPNAAAFSKYGNIPVSPYTGVPTINVPLYEIKIRDIKVPISLSYHASGIRVGEEASRVGLGWVLNAGGIITRNIVNRDDFQELPDAFLGSSAPAIPPGPVNVPSLRVQAGTTYGYYSTESQSGVPLYLDLAEYIAPTGIDPFFKSHDFEPDQFTYNFLGYSGKFIVNKNREVILEKQEKIRIRPLSTDGSTWEITTPDGFVYKFLDSEFFVDYNNTGGYRQKSAWYLTEIISPQKESVKFFYLAQENQYIIPVGSFYERWPSGNQFILCDFPCRDQNPRRYPIVGKYYSNIALDRIEWSHGKIKFNMASDREDIEGDKRVTSIHLYRNDAADPYEEIVFLHDYFTSSSMGSSSTSEFPTNNPEKALKRLKLSGITRRGLPFATSQPEQYSFTYYDEIFPPKNSFARDHWGFYNGKYGNTSLIPEYKRVVAGAPTPSRVIGIMGTERDPSPNHVRALSLKSITYPTKGTTTFSYASNTFDFNPFENTNDEPESYPETTPFIYNASQKGVVQSKLFDLRDEFVDDDGNVVPVTVRAAFRTNMSATCDQVLGTPNVYFEVVNEAGLSFGVITPNGTRCTSPEQVGCITCVSGSPVFDYTGSFILPPGEYYWKAYMPVDEAQIVDIVAQFTWMVDAKKRPQLTLESDGSLKMYRIGGGLRVNQIEDYVPESDTRMNIRRYDYHYKTDENEDGVMETHSYGRRMLKPSYSYFDVTWEEKSTIVGLQRCYQCITLVRDSGHPHANYDGNSVAYDKVREYLGESGENGYTDYEYENQEDEVKNYNYPYPTDAGGEIPLLPPYSSTIKNTGNGNLLRQTHYTASGEKLMMTENTYQTKYNNIAYALESREIPADMDVLGGAYLLLSYESMISNFSYLSKTIATSYLPGEIESNKVETQYFYDNNNHLQLTKQVTGKSNLHKQVTQYKYPADYPDVESNVAILDMKGDKFMHALPVETTVLDEAPDGSQMIQQREFTVFDNFGGFSLPKERVTLKNTGFVGPTDVPAYIPSGTYDAQIYKKVFALDYDTESGNLKKIQKESDMPVGYLWGHDNSLPIAEIKNATAEEAFYTSFEEGGDLFTDASGSLARTGLKVTNSTTYTFPAEYTPIESNTLMSYWYWENNQWNFSGVIPFQRTITTSGSRIDEVRAFPKGAQMTTFTHLLMVGISSQTDPNNQTTYYEYDEMSRLKLIRDSNKKIVKSYEYAYKR